MLETVWNDKTECVQYNFLNIIHTMAKLDLLDGRDDCQVWYEHPGPIQSALESLRLTYFKVRCTTRWGVTRRTAGCLLSAASPLNFSVSSNCSIRNNNVHYWSGKMVIQIRTSHILLGPLHHTVLINSLFTTKFLAIWILLLYSLSGMQIK